MGKLDALIKQFNSDYKEDIASRGIPKKFVKKIPFSSPRVNYMLYGGLPRGRIVEFAGDEGGGKTTTALDVVKNAQIVFKEEHDVEIAELNEIKKPTKTQQTRLKYLESRGPKKVAYIDCENTLDEEWAIKIGVDVDDMIIMKPMSQSAEQIFEMILKMMETDELGLVVLDSLGVMISQQAYEKTMEEKTYGGIAAPLTLFSKKAELLCVKYDVLLIGINQMREDMNSQHGGMITTGGKGWKHNCSVRLMFQKGAFLDERGNELKRSAEEPKGNKVNISIVKTKVCKPDRRTGFYTLTYDNGINALADTVEVAIKYGLIHKAGSWFTFVDLETGELLKDEEDEDIKIQGQVNVVEFLREEEWLLEEIEKELATRMGGL